MTDPPLLIRIQKIRQQSGREVWEIRSQTPKQPGVTCECDLKDNWSLRLLRSHGGLRSPLRGHVLTLTHVRSGGAKEHAELEALMIHGGSMFVRRFFQVIRSLEVNISVCVYLR